MVVWTQYELLSAILDDVVLHYKVEALRIRVYCILEEIARDRAVNGMLLGRGSTIFHHDHKMQQEASL